MNVIIEVKGVKVPPDWDKLDTKTQKRFIKHWVDVRLHSVQIKEETY